MKPNPITQGESSAATLQAPALEGNGADSDKRPTWLEKWQAKYHGSHDCSPGPCICKCGCTQWMGCRNMGGLCSVCHVKFIRGHDEHGFKDGEGPL